MRQSEPWAWSYFRVMATSPCQGSGPSPGKQGKSHLPLAGSEGASDETAGPPMPHLGSTEAHAFTCLIFIHSSMCDLLKASSGQNTHLAKFQKISLSQDRSLKFFFQGRLLPCFQKNTLRTLWLWTMKPSVYPGMGERVGGEPHSPAWP